MPNSEPFRKVTCPACGGPLPLAGQTKCPFCGTLVERTAPPPPEPAVPEEHAPVTEIQAEPTHVRVVEVPAPSAQPAAARRSIGCAVGIMALAVVALTAGAVAYLLSSRKAPQIPLSVNRSVSGVVVPVPADRAGPPDLLVPTYHIDDETRTLAYLDGINHTLRWDSPVLSKDAYDVPVLVGPSLIYLTDETRLLALNRTDGQVAWQATLSDSVESSLCPDCLRLVGNHLVVLSQDGTLQSFDARTGRPAWSKRLNETPRNLWVIGDKVAVLDEAKEGEQSLVSLYIWDPTSGDVVRKLTPGYLRDDYGHTVGLFSVYGESVLVSPAGDAVYFFYGLSPAAAERWDPTSGKRVWQTLAEDEYFDRFTTQPMLIGDTIYASYDHYVLAVNSATGELRRLADDEDYQLTLLTGQGGMLIVSAMRTRGSQRYELWGLDASTGERKWQNLLANEAPLGEAGSMEEAYACQLNARGFVLIHLSSDPKRLVLETIDVQTGKSSGQTSIDIGDDRWSWNDAIWSDDTVWLTTIDLYAVDLATGKLLYKWP